MNNRQDIFFCTNTSFLVFVLIIFCVKDVIDSKTKTRSSHRSSRTALPSKHNATFPTRNDSKPTKCGDENTNKLLCEYSCQECFRTTNDNGPRIHTIMYSHKTPYGLLLLFVCNNNWNPFYLWTCRSLRRHRMSWCRRWLSMHLYDRLASSCWSRERMHQRRDNDKTPSESVNN